LPKTILVAANIYPPKFIGGAELVAHRHACIMRDAGHRVIVYAGEARPGSTQYSINRGTYEGIDVYRVQLKAMDYSPDFVSFYHAEVERHFASLLETCRPDVVHFHNLNGLSTGIISQAAASGAVTVLTAHDYWGFCFRNTLLLPDMRVCQDRTACADCQMYIHDGHERTIPMRMRNDFMALEFQALDRLIAPSRFLAAAYVESGLVPAEKAIVVHNGADIARLAEVPRKPSDGPVRFSYIGHIGPHKGVATLIEAFARLCAQDQPAVLSVVGQGEQREELERMAAALGVAGKVRFTGKIDNREIDRIYRETDVLVVPSVWYENQPVTIMEAMASRTAVIASRIGGIPEFVEHRKTGLLFEPGNAQDLAARMQEMIDSPAERQAYAEQAWRAIQEETYERQAARVMEVYDEAAAGRAPRRQTVSPPDQVVIACIGERLDWQCADAIDRITRAGAHPDWRFVMSSWLNGDYSPAAVAWVTDMNVTPAEVQPALAARLPLLVPERHAALRRLSTAARCGLFYQKPDDIQACLERLASDKLLRTTLGENGFQSRAPEARRRVAGS
jgi:glycosyltransferase involved in cell wall biosynthesis